MKLNKAVVQKLALKLKVGRKPSKRAETLSLQLSLS
jgi:hypothetical protein